MSKAIPDRWLNYSPIGKRIAGTRFIAFKVPLRENVNKNVDDEKLRLAPRSLMKSLPNLGLIVDLTNTNRYYDPQTFEDKNVMHQKLCIPGHHTPSKELAQKFCQYVNKFLDANADNDKLIGVHCTHGVNRTGYLICYYMILKMNMSPTLAMQTFADARGHKIERTNYTQSLQHLKERTEQVSSQRKSESSYSNNDDYSKNESKYFQKLNEHKDVKHENWRSRPQEQHQKELHSNERRKFSQQQHQPQHQPQQQQRQQQHHQQQHQQQRQQQQPQRRQYKMEDNYNRRRGAGGYNDNQANSSRYQTQRNWRYRPEEDQRNNSGSRNYHPYSRTKNNYSNYSKDNRDSRDKYNYNYKTDNNKYNNNYSRNNNNNTRTESRTKLNRFRDHE